MSLVMTTRNEYHQKRLKKAVARAMEDYYDQHGSELRWEKWEFEDERRLIENVTKQIEDEDGMK